MLNFVTEADVSYEESLGKLVSGELSNWSLSGL